jgi:hypothetical protein
VAAQETDDGLIAALQSCIGVFKWLELPATAEICEEIESEARKKKGNRLSRLYKNLQISAMYEYATTDHRKRCIAYLTTRMKEAATKYHKEVVRVVNAVEVATIPNRRAQAFKIQGDISRVILNGYTNEYERLLGLSFAYATAVEGVYKASIQDCYVWEKLGTGEKIEPKKVPNMKISDILDYYKRVGSDISIFEGYDSIVRNAVAHSTIEYNEQKRKMLYKDNYGQNERIQEYAFEELFAMYDKLKDVFELTLLKNQILRINDVCDTFVKRYPS